MTAVFLVDDLGRSEVIFLVLVELEEECFERRARRTERGDEHADLGPGRSVEIREPSIGRPEALLRLDDSELSEVVLLAALDPTARNHGWTFFEGEGFHSPLMRTLATGRFTTTADPSPFARTYTSSWISRTMPSYSWPVWSRMTTCCLRSRMTSKGIS